MTRVWENPLHRDDAPSRAEANREEVERRELRDARFDAEAFGYLTCPGCGERVELDGGCDDCEWTSPLVREGLI
jgi:predicted nucleic acid binding AN1-type Zn finger protein